MPVTELKLQYESSVLKEDNAVAIIVAAGTSSRMNGINKQLAQVGGMPVIARTVSKFESSPYISRIILVVNENDILTVQNICSKNMFDKVTDIIKGGSCRHESVLNGLAMLSKDEEKVVIHDGARPLVNDCNIKEVVLNLNDFACVTSVVKIVDTIKSLNADGTVKNTVDRTNLYLSQTPQGIRVSEYYSALKQIKNPKDFTDDAAIMEAAGKTVKTVEGSRENIKITTREDLSFAEAFLKEEE